MNVPVNARTAELVVETVPVESLVEWPGNPRRGNVDLIAESLATHGRYRPVLVQASSARIIAGNHTWKGAQKLGWATIQVVRLDVDDDQARRILLIDNRSSDDGTYDQEDLLAILNGLPDLAGTGWIQEDLAALSAELEAGARTWADRPVRPLPENPTSVRGQKWRLGPHTLVCGDSKDPANWTPLAEAGGAHMLLTDPPYGIAYTGAATGVERARIAGDATGSEAADLVGAVLDVLPLRPGALSYVFTATGADGVLVQAELVRRRLMRQGLVWAKQAPTLTRSDYQQQHELIVEGGRIPDEDWPEHESLAYGWDPRSGHRRVVDRRHRTILHFDRPSSSHDHPTMKPVPLLQHLIAAHKLPAGSIVAEPFGGSGSTLVACQLEGLVSYVVEFEPAYCDVILDRWRDGSGLEPVEVFW